MQEDGPPLEEKLLVKEHYVWETAVWICVSGRKLVKRADGTHRIVPVEQVVPTDKVLPNELLPCTVTVCDNGTYEYRENHPAHQLLGLLSRRPPRERTRTARGAASALPCFSVGGEHAWQALDFIRKART